MIHRVLAWVRQDAVPASELTLETLFRRHADDVHRMIRRLLGPGATEADVDDLVQQVFLHAHRALPRFRGESKTSTWLYGIATKTVLNFLRGRRRYRAMVERLDTAPALDRSDRRLEDRDELRRVWRCLLEIKPKKRVVFVLHEIEGLSAPEIAAMLDVGEPTVRSRLHHARRELMALLAEEGSG